MARRTSYRAADLVPRRALLKPPLANAAVRLSPLSARVDALATGQLYLMRHGRACEVFHTMFSLVSNVTGIGYDREPKWPQVTKR
jgi:hypothetical protein